jgi:hypothetical protein
LERLCAGQRQMGGKVGGGVSPGIEITPGPLRDSCIQRVSISYFLFIKKKSCHVSLSSPTHSAALGRGKRISQVQLLQFSSQCGGGASSALCRLFNPLPSHGKNSGLLHLTRQRRCPWLCPAAGPQWVCNGKGMATLLGEITLPGHFQPPVQVPLPGNSFLLPRQVWLEAPRIIR